MIPEGRTDQVSGCTHDRILTPTSIRVFIRPLWLRSSDWSLLAGWHRTESFSTPLPPPSSALSLSPILLHKLSMSTESDTSSSIMAARREKKELRSSIFCLYFYTFISTWIQLLNRKTYLNVLELYRWLTLLSIALALTHSIRFMQVENKTVLSCL